MIKLRHADRAGMAMVVAACMLAAGAAHAGEKDMAWLKGLCPDGALAWDHGGAMLLEVKTGQTVKMGSGKFLEFSIDGSFVGWNDNGKAMVYARKSGIAREIVSAITGHVSWISDREIVVYAGGWKRIDVITGDQTVPEGLSAVVSAAIRDEDDLKMTEDGHWVALVGNAVKSDAADKTGASRPGLCSGSLSKYGYEVGGLEHSHTDYTFRAARGGGKDGDISWGISCSGKGMDNNRFSSTSRDWIVNMNECASAMAAHHVPTNDFVLLGTSAKTSAENYGDFSHTGPKLDFGTTTTKPQALIPAKRHACAAGRVFLLDSRCIRNSYKPSKTPLLTPAGTTTHATTSYESESR